MRGDSKYGKPNMRILNLKGSGSPQHSFATEIGDRFVARKEAWSEWIIDRCKETINQHLNSHGDPLFHFVIIIIPTSMFATFKSYVLHIFSCGNRSFK